MGHVAAPPLLSSKYAPPPLRSAGVERPGLLAALAEPRALALVSAPPGYGKTTLLASWLASEGRTAAWLTLDESDDDPAVFLAYLVAAVRRAGLRSTRRSGRRSSPLRIGHRP